MSRDLMVMCRVCSEHVSGPEAAATVRWATCEKCVPIQRTNYDPALAVRIKDAEAAVVEAAVEWERYAESYDSGLADVVYAVRALRTVKGEG